MKKNLFKFFLLGAFTLALGFGFTSCDQGVSEADFKKACTRIDALELNVETLQNDLKALGYVKSVTQKDGADNVLVVTYASGNVVELTIPVPAVSGVGGSTITQDGGYWVFDGVKTAYPVAPAEGWQGGAVEPVEPVELKYPFVNEDGYWEFANEEGEYEVSEYYAGPWATVEDDESIVLWVKAAGSDALEPINLTKMLAGAGVAKIDILGWVTSYDEAVGNGLSLDDEVFGKTLTDDHSSGAAPYRTLAAGDPFDVNYAWIKVFKSDADHSYLSTASPADNALAAWNGGNENILKGSVMNTLGAQRRGILVQVHPADQDITSWNNITMTDSQGRVLPIGFGNPVPVTARLTRAAAESALYFIPAKIKEGVYANDDAFKAGFRNMFASDTAAGTSGSTGTDAITSDVATVWSLKVNGLVVSEYTPFTFVSIPASSSEAPVEEIQITNEAGTDHSGADVLVKIDTAPAVQVNGGQATDPAGTVLNGQKVDYIVEVGKWYQPRFLTTDDALTGGVTNSVIDYYLELVDTESEYDSIGVGDADKSYIMDQFGLKFNGPNGTTKTTFSVGRLPDNLTLAWFDLNVYKLGIDGVIYVETVRIRPVRSDVDDDVYPNLFTGLLQGDYPIIDKNFTSADALVPGEYMYNVTSSHLSGSMVFDLTPMFDGLSLVSDGQYSNLAQRWQNPTYGAQSFTVRNVSIGGTVLNTTTTPTLAAFTASFAEAIITGHDTKVPVKDGTASHTNAANVTDNRLYDTRSIVIQPTYADAADTGNPPATPMFQVDKEYIITVDFYDNDGDYLNTLKMHFTPRIVADDLIAKDVPFWNDGTRGYGLFDAGADEVLNAFYKNPNSWAELVAPNANRYDIALGNYTAAVSDGPGGNGAFTKFGMAAHSAESWANLAYEIAKDGNIDVASTTGSNNAIVYPTANGSAQGNAGTDNIIAAATIVAANEDDNIFTLLNQYVPDPQNKDNDANTTMVSYDLYHTPAELAADATNYYGKIFNVVPNAASTLYLGVYPMPASVMAKLPFKMRIMSALYEGDLVTAEGGNTITIPAAPAGVFRTIDKDDVKGYTYNQQPYDIFKVWNAGESNSKYVYTYIDKVEFIEAAGQNYYSVVDENGAPTTKAVDPAVAPATGSTWGYLNIGGGNVSQDVSTTLTIRVYDRFGKVKEEAMTLNIEVVD